MKAKRLGARPKKARAKQRLGAAFIFLAIQGCHASLDDNGGGPAGGGSWGDNIIDRVVRKNSYPFYGKVSWHFRTSGFSGLGESGYTGAGVVVGIVDTGVDTSHPAIGRNILRGFNARIGGSEIQDDVGHGTSMASLIAGAEIDGLGPVGVAPGAKLIVVKANSPAPRANYFDDTSLMRGIDYATEHGAQIINLSLGSPEGSTASPSFRAISRASAKGVIVFVATGNDGNHSKPSFYARKVGTHFFGNNVVAVAALDQNQELASYSSPCDVHDPNYCISASGSGVIAAKKGGGYGKVSGTSAATAIASGSMAILLEAHDHLTNSEALEILLRTTDDLGAAGVDRVYGRGAINLGRALEPVGAQKFIDGSEAADLQRSFVAAQDSAFAAAFAQAPQLEALSISDEYARDFERDMRKRVFLGGVGAQNLSPQTQFNAQDLREFSELGALLPFDQLHHQSGALDHPDAQARNEASKAEAIFADPFVKIGALSERVQLSRHRADGGAFVRLDYSADSEMRNHALGIGAHYEPVQNLMLGIGAMQYEEEGQYLGTVLSGNFGEIATSKSHAAMIGAAVAGQNWSAYGRASFVRSKADFRSEGSFISELGAASSNAWALGLSREELAQKGDRLSLALSQGLRVETGSAKLNAKVLGVEQLSLAPKGREIALDVGYTIPVTDKLTATANAGYVHDAHHLEGRGAEISGGIQFRYRF